MSGTFLHHTTKGRVVYNRKPHTFRKSDMIRIMKNVMEVESLLKKDRAGFPIYNPATYDGFETLIIFALEMLRLRAGFFPDPDLWSQTLATARNAARIMWQSAEATERFFYFFRTLKGKGDYING